MARLLKKFEVFVKSLAAFMLLMLLSTDESLDSLGMKLCCDFYCLLDGLTFVYVVGPLIILAVFGEMTLDVLISEFATVLPYYYIFFLR